MAVDAPLLEVTGLQKSYNVPVLDDFSFELRRGEVHALVGSNGAGKSTFARILSGLTPSNGGAIRLDGQPYAPGSKRAAEQAGVILVLQELNVLPTLSVAENIFLNRLPHRGGLVRFELLHERARQALARVGLSELAPETPAGELGVGHQQLVENAAALSQSCRLLILDEPTAALTDPEIDRLFENIRLRRSEGVGILYISHRMEELRRIADRITVMRDGRRIATHEAQEVSSPELIRELAGHDLPARAGARPVGRGRAALHVRHLRAGKAVQDVSFDACGGEILGVAGLIGAGRTETLRAIFGADPKDSGEVLVGERQVTIRHPRHAVEEGIALVPEDRKRDGLLLPLSIRINTTLSTLGRHARPGGWLDTDAETRTTHSLCRRLGVRCASIEQPVGELSGGTQQKVLMARWLARDADVFLFDEPTRGIDIAAKDTIYALLRQLADAGKAVVVVSSDLVELMSLSDRIVVMSQGRVTAEFAAGEWSQEKITRAAFSGHMNSRT